MSALIAALLPYFPHGLPADNAEACEMVCQAQLHLFPADFDFLRQVVDSNPEAYTTLGRVLDQIQIGAQSQPA